MSDSSPGLTIQSLFRRHFATYLRKWNVSQETYRAVWRVAHCRTAMLGGHANVCPAGHYRSIAYNSCGHRSCPQCGWLETQRWLDRQRAKLLPCPHHHVVFTLPSELLPIWHFNGAAYAKLLFHVVQETLKQLLGDAKYLAARPGLLCALHTWNQLLQPHIHLHCLVTAGGLDANGQWQNPKKTCLLPRKVLMLKFRGKFVALLRKAVSNKTVRLPPGMSQQDFQRLLDQSFAKPWNVKIHAAYQHAAGVACYLARYLKHGPIKNQRLIAERDGQVHFRYRVSSAEGGDGKRQDLTQLPVLTFLRRWLLHVPPKGLQTVRGYGLYSGNQHSHLDQARRALGLAPPTEEETAAREPTWQELWEAFAQAAGLEDFTRCPTCRRRLIRSIEIQSIRGPPAWCSSSNYRNAAA